MIWKELMSQTLAIWIWLIGIIVINAIIIFAGVVNQKHRWSDGTITIVFFISFLWPIWFGTLFFLGLHLLPIIGVIYITYFYVREVIKLFKRMYNR